MIALASATVSSAEMSHVSIDDCFAALCLAHPVQVDTIPEKALYMIPKLVVFVRSQIHSYAYHLVSVREHNQHVRSPIQGFDNVPKLGMGTVVQVCFSSPDRPDLLACCIA